MTSVATDFARVAPLGRTAIQHELERLTEELLASLPDADHMTDDQRRAFIARYTAVLEGNFIYWMTGAYLAVRTSEAKALIRDNLLEEVRDSHPAMMRRFAIAAQAIPTAVDNEAVYESLAEVRRFVGRLSPIPLLVMMAFFEGFLQRFMPYLATLAKRQGSSEFEYTDVHGVCDVEHTDGLLRALEAEIAIEQRPAMAAGDLLEGVVLLRTLFDDVIAA